MPYCIQCGKELNEGARFCFHCGASVPNAQTASTPTPQAPPVSVTPTPQPTPVITTESMAEQPPRKKKPNGWKIFGWSLYAAIPLLIIGFIFWGLMVSSGIIPDYSGVKNSAKREVTEFWQEWDEDMELVSITYDSIKEDEWDEDEIEAYVVKWGDRGITDVDGTEYDTHWDYWEAENYDPYTETYKVYTVRGDYHVTDNRKQDYEGWYCVTIVHAVNENSWRIEGTEMELPDELKQYLPD